MDVYRVAVQMKKGRTGVQVTVLCRPDLVHALRDILFRETTTIGLHWRVESKIAWPANFKKLRLPGEKCKSKSPAGPPAKSQTHRRNMRLPPHRHCAPRPSETGDAEAMRIYAANAAKES